MPTWLSGSLCHQSILSAAVVRVIAFESTITSKGFKTLKVHCTEYYDSELEGFGEGAWRCKAIAGRHETRLSLDPCAPGGFLFFSWNTTQFPTPLGPSSSLSNKYDEIFTFQRQKALPTLKREVRGISTFHAFSASWTPITPCASGSLAERKQQTSLCSQHSEYSIIEAACTAACTAARHQEARSQKQGIGVRPPTELALPPAYCSFDHPSDPQHIPALRLALGRHPPLCLSSHTSIEGSCRPDNL